MDFYAQTPERQVELLQGVAKNAVKVWGFDPESVIKPVKYRENSVYKLTTPHGQSFAIRVHRAGYHSDDALRSELMWMDALRVAGVATPKVQPSQNGLYVETISADGVPEPRQVDMLEWIDCTPLGSIEDGIDEENLHIYRDAGRLMARLHCESEAWTLPNGFVRDHWDSVGLLGEEPIWGRGWDHPLLTDSQRNLILDAREHAIALLEELPKDKTHYGLIHCDFLPENLLVDGKGEIHLIDFDDAGFGYHMFDIATTLFWFMGEECFDTMTEELLAGYTEVHALEEEQLALLPWFLFIRGLVYLGWAHTRPETEIAQALTPILIEALEGLATELLQTEAEQDIANA
ncbi:phosphotransferase [Vibrio sp. SCSIO 43136]|uniref:phosphotransferase enzyme family protein n=1 Tax=Vibrio sp. SCSIO 43136 TaxID=2819101 RepID=UPI002075B356|nr:phosphotransferase [Vibrio sp. SCSIO 43136]USD66222.1 phosphotransferase [Vibrio sp. SCSIO 43136]